MNIIKVASDSKTSAVAGAIANAVREDKRAEVQAIGAGAVNRAIKATIIASRFLAEEDVFIVFVPHFVLVTIGDKERTAVRLSVAPRQNPPHREINPTEMNVAAPLNGGTRLDADDELLHVAEEMKARNLNRWELTPASVSD